MATSDIVQYLNVSYDPSSAPNPLRHFDLYNPRRNLEPSEKERPPLICFVHGGAWRSEDKTEHATFAERLARESGIPVAVPNYRLTTPSTPLQHPVHAQDILHFLNFVRTWKGPTDQLIYDPNKLYLIGHSCSAHMLASIFLASPDLEADASLAPSPDLLASTRGLVFSEGIYDIDLLLQSFPGYKEWFIANTFGDRSSYAEFNVAAYNLRPGGEHIRWLLMHSHDDTLVDQVQSESMFVRLQALKGGDVEKDWESLRGEHNNTLKSDVYLANVTRFVLVEPSQI